MNARYIPICAVSVALLIGSVPLRADELPDRLSGDSCDVAIPISGLPFSDWGDTCQFSDIYDEICPFNSPGAPDVVYVLVPDYDVTVDISLCKDSNYDTKLYVYEDVCGAYQSGTAIACNDDSCSTPSYPDPYVSEILGLDLAAGVQYYIMVDGYSVEDCGDYTLDITLAGASALECPAEAVAGQPAHLPSENWVLPASDAYDWGAPLCYEYVPALATPIGGVHWWGVMMESESPCTDSDPTFEIRFYEDFDGTPGAQICSYTTTATITPTGVWYEGWFELLYFTADAIEPCCELPEGGWVSIQGFGDEACVFFWLSSGTGDGMSWRFTDGTPTWEYYDLSLCLLECPYEDCNNNGIPDEEDLANCQGEPWCDDCNGNGILDECDIADETSMDCQEDGIPDECQLTENDCNENSVPDDCDIAEGYSTDWNGNGVPDDCEPDCNNNGYPDDWDLSIGDGDDCNGNGLLDECDITDGAPDVNFNAIPDECEPDCNGNGVPDAWDISTGTSADCDGNGIPDECDIADGAADVNGNGVLDECEADCNGNGLPDAWDIDSGVSADCNANGIPDECDLVTGAADVNINGVLDECELDCNANGVPDDWDVSSGDRPDCNGNGVPDECDLADGTSLDANENGLPDECEEAGRELTDEEYSCFMRGLLLLMQGVDVNSDHEDIDCVLFALDVLAGRLEETEQDTMDGTGTPDGTGDQAGQPAPATLGTGVCPIVCGVMLSVTLAGLFWTRRRGER
ncbi:MAG: hypothetical protein ABIG44_02260 [Planctomycetota bacterium]